MNILFLNQVGHIAGSTLSVTYLAKGLAERGHACYVGCRPFSLQSMLLSGTRVKAVHLCMRSGLDMTAMRRVRDIVDRHEIDVVNAQSSYDRNVSIYSRYLTKWPAVLVHTRRQMPASSGGRLQSWFYHRGTDGIIAVSDAVKQGLIKRGIPGSHIHVIYNGTPREKYAGIEKSRIERLRARHGIDPRDRVIGCVARPHKQKYHMQLLKALKRVKTPVTVLFVGTHMRAEYAGILKMVRDRHTVLFCGLVPPLESLHYFHLFTLFVLPSCMEGLSQAMLEAMAMNVPVIATRAGGNADIIQDGENGFLFDNNDIAGLAGRIEQLLRDTRLCKSVSARAKKFVFSRFSIDRTVQAHESLFQSLLDAGYAK